MSAQVLLVDDDVVLLEALSDALRLRLESVELDACDSAVAALERIAVTDYDAIVADIKMPGMDGLELLDRIRGLRPNTPTILITGHGEHDLAVQALRGGAQDYVQKPIDREYFVSSLRRAIECHQLSRTLDEHKEMLERHASELEDCVRERTNELREFYHRERMACAQLDEANRRLEEVQRQRNEFISMVAHDLGQPLTSLLGYAELLGRPAVSEELHQRAHSTILSEIQRMSRLVQDLVDSQKIYSDRFTIQSSTCDLVGLASEQIELARMRTNRHEITLDVALDPVDAVCDRDRVAQVIANLLTNAISHTDGGRIHVRVWLEAQQACISVSDEGPGIPADQLEAIFEPHVRLSESRGDDETGSQGLGLHIARRIIEAHGGQMWAESPVGRGATFNVCLPQAPATGTAPAQ
jgi:two-component system, sensor histidine kinase and response regulator